MDCSNNGVINAAIFLGIIYTVHCLSSQCSVPLSENCQYKFNNGSIIDLSRIARNDLKPRFKDIGDGKNPSVSYNPCINFKEDANCNVTEGVGVCLHTAPYISLGSNGNACFQENNSTGLLEIVYTANSRGAIVSVVCGKDYDELEINGTENKDIIYTRLTLFTRHACLGSSSKPGLSAGSVMLIIFFVACAVYFLGGMLIMRLVRGATGKEMIPHYDFWVDLPNLILDGIYFVVRGCKADTAYDRI